MESDKASESVTDESDNEHDRLTRNDARNGVNASDCVIECELPPSDKTSDPVFVWGHR